MLDSTKVERLKAYFAAHPVLSRYADRTCIALTGSYAVGLGGQGADVDAKVLCPPDVYEVVKGELLATGRITDGDEPEEEFDELVGDYTLEDLSAVWLKVQAHGGMTPLFVYGSLVYLAGDGALLDPLVSHCRTIPPAILQREIQHERSTMAEAVYAFLRSFQNADPVARLLARTNIVRCTMRLAFLTEGSAPPYDKHLFRLLPRTAHGQQVARLVQRFLGESGDALEAMVYAEVAAAEDWHAMYAVAHDTPALRFQKTVLHLLDLP